MAVSSFLCKTLGFLVLPFMDLDAQINCLKKWYTDLKSALDQPLPWSFGFGFGFLFLELFLLGPGWLEGMGFWWSDQYGRCNRWFLGCVGVSDVSLMKSQRSMSSISPLTLTSKISSITSVIVEGS